MAPKTADGTSREVSKAETPKDGQSRMKPRRTTDLPWAFLFIVAMGGMWYVIQYANSNYDKQTLEELKNYGVQAAQHSGQDASVQQYKDEFTKIIAIVQAVLNESGILTASAFFALVAGFIYLWLLKVCAGLIIKLCLCFIVLCPFAAGAYLVYAGQNPDANLPTFATVIDGCGTQCNLIAAAGFGAIGLILACCVLCSFKAIELAVACVKVGISCIYAIPSMLIAPVIHFVSLLIAVPSLVSGLLLLLATGDIQGASAGNLASAAYSGNLGTALGIQYTTEQQLYILYYLLVIFWIVELIGATSQFVMAHSVVLWYFTPNNESGSKQSVSCGSVLCGYFQAARYHAGTLIFGSFLAAVLGLLRFIAALVEYQGKHTENPLVQGIAACVGCCVDCLKHILDTVNKNAYVDVAMESNSYCKAVAEVLKVFTKDQTLKSLGILTGALWIMTFAGVGAVTGLIGFGVFTHATQNKLANPTALAIGAGIVAAFVSLIIMNVLDSVVSDVLYCYAADQEHIREEGNHSFLGRFACCGIGGGVNKALHSETSTKVIQKFSKEKAPKQYTPKELQPLLHDH